MEYRNIRALAGRREIVLGSGSPRRLKLLGEVGIKFKQITPQVSEEMNQFEEPFQFALRLAESKASRVAERVKPEQVVIGCDTIVVHENEVLGKPGNDSEARKTLRRLAGSSHLVCTALALSLQRKIVAKDYELTSVKFNDLTDQQIAEYVSSGEPLDKAGAYGIQGMGAFLVDSIEGSLDNVIGLPRNLLERLAGGLLEHEKGR